MDSEISSVTLRIRAPATMCTRAPLLAEGFARRALERCDELLEQRCPGVVFLVRDLDLSLRLLDGRMESADEVDAVAGAVADHIEAEASFHTDPAVASSAAAGANIMAFRDDVEWRAVHVETWAGRPNERLWQFEPLESEGEPFATFTAVEHHARLRRVLDRLRSRRTLESTLAALPPELVAAADRALAQPPDRPLLTSRSGHDEGQATPVRDDVGDVVDAHRSRTMALAHPKPENGDPAPLARPTVLSAFGGVVYLVNVALDLSLGEILWRACLPEGHVLARALATIVGAPDDPAPSVLGGAAARDPLPPIAAGQQHEVAIAVLQSLIDALARRGPADRLEPWLSVVDTDHGRLLLAVNGSGRFVFFASPAQSVLDLQAALDAFLSAWPANAPRPRGSRALAGLDRRLGVRPSDASMEISRAAIVDGHSLAASALLTQVAGTLALFFAARVGLVTPESPAIHGDLMEPYFAVPAEIRAGDDLIDVRMPMESIDLAIRRAGLDRDPGWIPWLQRKVTITFTDARGDM